MPLTTHGKIYRYILKALLDPNSQKLPQVQCVCARSSSTVKLTLKMPDDLIYFPDHFSGCPILSGVVQIALAEHSTPCFLPLTDYF